MSQLNTDVTRVYELGDTNELPIAADTLIYEGVAVGDNGEGYVRPLQGGDAFRGFADRHANNTGGLEGDKSVRIRKQGTIVLPLPGAKLTDVGKIIYATDDNTFTLTQTNATLIGRIARLESSGQVVVDFHVSLSIHTN